MKHKDNPRQLGSHLPQRTARDGLAAALGIVVGAALIVTGAVLSLVALTVIAAIGTLGFAYLWWKTRALRRHLRDRMAMQANRDPAVSSPDDTARGDIIEGSVIREEREKRD